ncbi:ABC transporter permease subunit [Microbacterium sp. M3]|uniref:ABC transporter permease subunit n=1 Tax=Microbacterium arthrosphaerae TaxID=792652 RepID=A0ABU4H599_9MICO|nr:MULTISPECIES: ABC transporter permease subunit [Microbacterium]MDW4574523.1 ABC transporter permease subunit [Microbacterium arthrosphaerae]MDW7608378.1 ABC transporter permease subunit [Microbacterium sp. M3]
MNDLFRLPLGAVVETGVRWVIDAFSAVFDTLAVVFGGLYDWLDAALSVPPFWAVILVVAAFAYWSKGLVLAVGSAVGLLVIVAIGQWANAMDSLALVILAAAVAIVIAVPLGIWAARNDRVSAVLRPVLDFLQTMPAFVYLIPAMLIFGVGPVPGMVATIAFALAPGVRLTELGIRGVDPEIVEAGHAFGATPGRILRQIQLPLAMPSIMAGVNQVIMLSLSMVVIAGMVGAGGLGGEVVQSLSRIDIALGVEAGLSVVILAMILDRVTSGFSAPRPRPARAAASADSGAAADADRPADAAGSEVRRPSADEPAGATASDSPRERTPETANA